jgi:cellulose biosynthesis protein BcsQ
MSTELIAIAAAKGGVSKSTICGALGVYAAAAGDKILPLMLSPSNRSAYGGRGAESQITQTWSPRKASANSRVPWARCALRGKPTLF